MYFGLTIEKVALLALVAGLIIGPERLPSYARKLAEFVKSARGYVKSTSARLREEMGEDFDDVDWQKLDPRQYDPRRIIRSALLEDPAPAPSAFAGKATTARTAISPTAASSTTISDSGKRPENEPQSLA